MCQVAVTNLTTACAALRTGFAGGEGREVIVKQEAVGTVVQHIVDDLLVQFRAQGDGGERLCLTTCEEGRSVRAGNIIHFTPDRTYLRCFSAVETFALVEDRAAHRLFLHVVVIFTCQCSFHSAFLFGHRLEECCQDGFKSGNTLVLVGVLRRSHHVGGLVTLIPYLLAQLFVLLFVAVGPFDGLTHHLGQFDLCLALFLDLFVAKFDGIEHLRFRDLIHLSLHHHDIVDGGTHHDVDVSLLQLLEGGVDHERTVDTCYTYFGDGSVERDVGYRQCSGCCQSGESIGHIFAVGREEDDVHENVGMVIVRKERTQHAVDKPACKYLCVGRSPFALHKSSRKTSEGGEFLFVFHR